MSFVRKAMARWPQRMRPTNWPVRWRLAGVSASANDATLVSAGSAACADLATKKPYNQMVAGLRARGFTTYEANLAIILGAQYQCPARIPQATQVMGDALNQLPPAA